MDDKLVKINQLKQAAERVNDLIGEVTSATADAIDELNKNKQDKISFLTNEEVLNILNGGTV